MKCFSKNVSKANNVPAPYEYYQRSHWSDELDQKITELAKATTEGYPLKIAITGAPGSGKTDLAKYYAYERAKKSSIVWSILADTPQNLWRNYSLLAEELKIGKIDKSSVEDDRAWHERICHKVSQFLINHPGWILIFDNVQQLSDVTGFLPKPGEQNGVIIFTSRNENLLDDKHRLKIGSGLDPDEAVNLLYKVTGITSGNGARELAATFDYLPLYLLITASTICNTRESDPENAWSYTSYNNHIQALSAEDVEVEHGLNIGQLDYNRTQHAVMRDAIEQLNLEDRELLVFCSYISPAGIPLKLLENFVRTKNNILYDDRVRLEFNKVLREIQRSSLLQQLPDQSVYDIHRVTQQIGRLIGRISQTQANIMLNAILRTFELIGDNIESSSSMEIWKPLLPHMLALSSYADILQIADQIITIKFIQYIGRVENILGYHHQSLQYFERVLVLQKIYSSKYEVAKTLVDQGSAYSNLGNTLKAQELYMEALPTLMDCKASKPYEVTKLLNSLGLCYYELGNVQEAIKLHNEALDTLIFLEDELKKASYRAIILNNVGNAYSYLGETEKAHDLYEQAYNILVGRPDYGPEHYEVATILANHSNAYFYSGDALKAQDLFQKILPILENHYGQDSYVVAITLANSGGAYLISGDVEEAKQLYEKALPILRKHYSYVENHYEVATTLNNIGNAYAKLGYTLKAQEVFDEASPILKSRYGTNYHKETIIACNIGIIIP